MRQAARPMSAWVAGGLALGACGEAAPELPGSLRALAFDTVFSIGAESGQPWEVFEGLWDLEADADGRLAILDVGGPVIHLFDAAGAHIGSIEETGLDEGQLDGPAAIAWSEPGELLVWDPGSSWVSHFSVHASTIDFVARWRAFAFGETGFCAVEDRAYLSYWQDGNVVHEVGPERIGRSFGPAPAVAGAERLGPDLLEIAVEELTPSALLCTAEGVVDIGFVQSTSRMHDSDGAELWSRTFDDFRPVEVYSDDGIGLGRAFDPEGSHLLRSAVPWGASMVLVQHELRTREIPEEGEIEVFESRLLSLVDGAEVDRSRGIPLVLAAQGNRLYLVQDAPFPVVTVVEVR
jgi:hypothetical protein